MIYSVTYDQKFVKNSKNWKKPEKSQKKDNDDFKNQKSVEGNSDHLPVIFFIPNFDTTYKRSNHVYPVNLKVELILKGK